MDACWAMYKAHFQGIFSFSYNQLQLAEYYLAYRRLAQHWKEALPPHALMEVRYENIVRDPAAQSRALIEFIGLPWEDGVLNFHESRAPSATASAVQVRRPVYVFNRQLAAPQRATHAVICSACAGDTKGGVGVSSRLLRLNSNKGT